MIQPFRISRVAQRSPGFPLGNDGLKFRQIADEVHDAAKASCHDEAQKQQNHDRPSARVGALIRKRSHNSDSARSTPILSTFFEPEESRTGWINSKVISLRPQLLVLA
ncbi:hypothetical protein AC629_33630 [Bradyrhizobium sp. NAS80.1]|nr:hypothetical protein AC629_33630 [Bradyrhizobium sp. NAS80.1]